MALRRQPEGSDTLTWKLDSFNNGYVNEHRDRSAKIIRPLLVRADLANPVKRRRNPSLRRQSRTAYSRYGSEVMIALPRPRHGSAG